MKIETIYGEFWINEPVLQELIQSTAVQRLQGLHQFGITHYLDQKNACYTRYDHSIGVMVLLRRYKCSLEEQIAGLLHDVSHTVFSHVADYLFIGEDGKDSYQDQIHQWYLEKSDVPQILQKHGLSISQVMHKNNNFLGLEQDLPDLCADRLEYTMYEYFLSKVDASHDLADILNHLHFENGKWFFDSLTTAKFYAGLALKFTQFHWASVVGMYVYTIAAQMLKRALDIKLLDREMIHFGKDDEVWQKLRNCSDFQIQDYIDKIFHHQQAFREASIDDYNLHLRGKFRGVDPLVMHQGRLQRLSELDQEFAINFANLRLLISSGFYLKQFS